MDVLDRTSSQFRGTIWRTRKSTVRRIYRPLSCEFALKEHSFSPKKPGRFKTAFSRPLLPSKLTVNKDNGIKNLFFTQMIKARRSGAWFRLLPRERGMYELAMRLNVKLLSHELLRALVSVLKSLRDVSDIGFGLLMRATNIAWGFSESAFKAGNDDAKEWRHDRGYINYLALSLESGQNSCNAY
jgi:hypothetical protein